MQVCKKYVKGWEEEEGCRAGRRSEDSSTTRNRWSCSFSYIVFVHVCARVCVFSKKKKKKKLFLRTHLDDRSCSALYFGSMTQYSEGFPPCSQACFSEPSLPPCLPSSSHPSLLFPSLGPPAGCTEVSVCGMALLWDWQGKQRFSPASKTSSRLSRVVPNVMKQYLGRLFSLPPTG